PGARARNSLCASLRTLPTKARCSSDRRNIVIPLPRPVSAVLPFYAILPTLEPSTPSCPALCRASTDCFLDTKKDVDGREKTGPCHSRDQTRTRRWAADLL